jgi:glutathione S-transferase
VGALVDHPTPGSGSAPPAARPPDRTAAIACFVDLDNTVTGGGAETGDPGYPQRDEPMRLYYSANPNPRVAVAVARHLGSPVEYVRASPRRPDQVEGFRAINPNALVPVLVEGERRLWEADAIACRLCAIAGSDFWRTGDEMAEMIMWVSWSAHHFNSAAGVLYFERLVRPRFSDEPAPASVLEEAMGDFRRYAATLDDHLGGRAWLLGDRLSYADFRVATNLPFADGAGLPVAEFRHVARWRDRLSEIDAWRAPFDGLE